MSNEMKEKIREYIVNELVNDVKNINDNTMLFSTRIISSRNLMQIIYFIEDEFSIKVNPMELTQENFDTINNISDFIISKKA